MIWLSPFWQFIIFRQNLLNNLIRLDYHYKFSKKLIQFYYVQNAKEKKLSPDLHMNRLKAEI